MEQIDKSDDVTASINLSVHELVEAAIFVSIKNRIQVVCIG